MIEWWYPVAVWAIVIAAVVRSIQFGFNAAGLSHAGPRWLPLAAATFAIVPIDGLPLARWLHSFSANFSIPLAILLLDFGISPLLRQPLLNRLATRTAIWFGFTCGLLLYPLSLGLGSFDPYELGWKSPGVAAVAAICGGGAPPPKKHVWDCALGGWCGVANRLPRVGQRVGLSRRSRLLVAIYDQCGGRDDRLARIAVAETAMPNTRNVYRSDPSWLLLFVCVRSC